MAIAFLIPVVPDVLRALTVVLCGLSVVVMASAVMRVR